MTKNDLRAMGIFNEHDLAKRDGGSNLYVCYRAQDNGRGGHSSGWLVIRVGHKTDPEGHWGEYGNKYFLTWGRHDKEEKRLEAIAWATARYGIQEWERSPFGSYHPKGTLTGLRQAARAREGASRG